MFNIKDNKDQSSIIDFFLWSVFTAIIGFGLYIYANNTDVATVIKLLFTLFLIFMLLSVAFFTKKGRIAYTFMLEASVELRKIVWPKREEIAQVTLMVAAVIVLISLLLWGIDSAFSALISFIAT
ncbi:MAG: preprotein translocase subunit SecE [Legionellales bacterium]|jgi:preprotein translocase subunit SecE|nr:preprotein translocase subunit SecE [Legionellales bacterium]